uniref:Uncharacterized protein n=1 Tax=Capitella teleta TaxID=283909 RepID=X2A7M0_CAPTE
MGGCRFCAVRGCVSRTGEGKSFFSLPKVPDLDKCLNINPSLHSLMVNRRRKPSSAKDPTHVDWAPCLNLPKDTLNEEIPKPDVISLPQENPSIIGDGDALIKHLHAMSWKDLRKLMKVTHSPSYGTKDDMVKRILMAGVPLQKFIAHQLRIKCGENNDLKDDCDTNSADEGPITQEEPTQWVVIDNKLVPKSSTAHIPEPIVVDGEESAVYPLVIQPMDDATPDDSDSDSCPEPITYFESEETGKQPKRLKKTPKWLDTYQTQLPKQPPSQLSSEALKEDALKAFLRPLWSQDEIKTDVKVEAPVVNGAVRQSPKRRKSRSPRKKQQRVQDVVPGKENFKNTSIKDRVASSGEHGKELRRKIQLPHWLDVYSAETSKSSRSSTSSRSRKRKR